MLDGYNIIHQLPSLSPLKFDEQRQALLLLLDSKRPQGSSRNKVTVVFDGQPGHVSLDTLSSIAVVYSQFETADDRIRRIVEDTTLKKNMVVVTNDRDVQYSVRGMGAQVTSVEEFFAKAHEPKRSPSQNVKTESGKNISKTLEFKINSEFSSIWLKKDKKNDV